MLKIKINKLKNYKIPTNGKFKILFDFNKRKCCIESFFTIDFSLNNPLVQIQITPQFLSHQYHIHEQAVEIAD